MLAPQNPTLASLLTMAIAAGKLALEAMKDPFRPRYSSHVFTEPDAPEPTTKSSGFRMTRDDDYDDHAEMELEFASKRDRSRNRRNMRRSDNHRLPQPQPQPQEEPRTGSAQDYLDDFTTAEQLLEDELGSQQGTIDGDMRELKRDVVAARGRWLQPGFTDRFVGHIFDDDERLLERFLVFLEELLDEHTVAVKVKDLRSCFDLGLPAYGQLAAELESSYRAAWDAEMRIADEVLEEMSKR